MSESIKTSSAHRTQKPPTVNRSAPPLDPGLYALTENQTAFFKELTGIKDDEELKYHIISTQHKAYEVCSPASPAEVPNELLYSAGLCVSVYSEIHLHDVRELYLDEHARG